MGLNSLLGFKDLTHLIPTQTHPFDTLTIIYTLVFYSHMGTTTNFIAEDI